MKVFICSSRDELGKFRAVVQGFPTIWHGLVLDVGCRSGHLKLTIPNPDVCYCGVDLVAPATVIANLEAGLPFGDASHDAVVALDILEHTDSIHRAFGELCRVARKYILIALPNAYEVKLRINFLFGQTLSGKYTLPIDPPLDRHRWLFSFGEAVAFSHMVGRRHGFEVIAEGGLVGPLRGILGLRFLVKLFPNLLAPSYVALLKKNRSNVGAVGSGANISARSVALYF